MFDMPRVRSTARVTVCAFLVLLGRPAAAQVAELPVLAVGDRWEFAVYDSVPTATANRIWIVTSLEQGRVHATENGQPLVLTAELNLVDSPRASETNSRALSFPLQVGKRWRYTSDWLFKPKSSRGRLVVDAAVVAHETVRVPAGEFAAFKLEARGELSGQSPADTFYAGHTTTTYWYAPAARAIVKSIHHNPYLGTTTTELIAFKAAAPAQVR